ncbi:MAG: hypothetical protein JSR73_12530 [Proteobacteria bacterium]|nr:hypothetical protein [Pseudomonadota bacterium]
MPPPVRRPVCACALALGLAAAAPARPAPPGDRHCTREDARAAFPAPIGHVGGSTLAEALAVEAARPLPFARSTGPDAAVPLVTSLRATPFSDHRDLASRLRGVRRLKLVPVYDDAWVTVFLGLDRRGVPGLHVQQQQGDDLGAMLWADAPPRARSNP